MPHNTFRALNLFCVLPSVSVFGLLVTAAAGCSTAPAEKDADKWVIAEIDPPPPPPPPPTCTACSTPSKRCKEQGTPYSCPATLTEMLAQIGPGNSQYCESTAQDSGKFDHVGRCFRQVTSQGNPGNQCCYDANTGLDNCTGTYDKIGTAGGTNADGTCQWLLSNIPAHCDVDVKPWCDAHKDPVTGRYCWTYPKTYDCNGNACPSNLPSAPQCADSCGCPAPTGALRCFYLYDLYTSDNRADGLGTKANALAPCDDAACPGSWVRMADGSAICMNAAQTCAYQTDGTCR